MTTEAPVKYNFLMIGDPQVGKTSIVHQFVHGNTVNVHNNQGQENYLLKHITIGSKEEICLKIWDCINSKDFTLLKSNFYKQAHGIILVFDLKNQDSFCNLPLWLGDVFRYTARDTPIMILGNKVDLEEERQISYVQAKQFTDEIGVTYFETSAVEDINVVEGFVELCVQTYQMMKTTKENRTVNWDKIQVSNEQCCSRCNPA